MRKPLILIFCLVVSTADCKAQDAESFKLTRSDLAGMEETRFATYEKNSLWGYINGGADLYLEYGFSKLMAQDFVWESEPFKVDVYIMVNPDAAFGIFSISRFTCKVHGEVGDWDCINPYQVQVAHDNLYISVVAYNGTERSMELATQIARRIVAKQRNNTFALPPFLSAIGLQLDASKLKLLKGPLGIQNAYATLEQAFSGVEEFTLWVAPYIFEGDSIEIFFANFQNGEQRELVEQRLLENEQFQVKSHGNKFMAILVKNTAIQPSKLVEIMRSFEQYL